MGYLLLEPWNIMWKVWELSRLCFKEAQAHHMEKLHEGKDTWMALSFQAIQGRQQTLSEEAILNIAASADVMWRRIEKPSWQLEKRLQTYVLIELSLPFRPS